MLYNKPPDVLLLDVLKEIDGLKNHESFEIWAGNPPDDILALRARFVREMKWFSESHTDDTDKYDSDVNTLHFAKRDNEGEIISTLRLTKLSESFEESLSYEIIKHSNLHRDSAAQMSSQYGDGILWDLTRLVFPLDQPQRLAEIEVAIIELFGMATRLTTPGSPEDDSEVFWVFVTSPWFSRFAKRNGIVHTVIAEGRAPDINGRHKLTRLCVVDVKKARTALMQNQRLGSFRHLQRGEQEAAHLTSG